MWSCPSLCGLPSRESGNARATARRIHDARFREHRLARAQNLLNYRHILGDELVNRTDGALDDLGGNRLVNKFCAKLSVGSVSRYLWIADWIACWIASGVKKFLGFVYGINMFVRIIVYGIADF